MRKSLFKRCLGVVATASVLALAFGPSAQAATTGTSPHWFNGHIDQFRAGGSETTFYVMNAINNLYSQSSIFGCVLLTSDFQTCNTGADNHDTDILDNYDRDEFNNGAGIGSGKRPQHPVWHARGGDPAGLRPVVASLERQLVREQPHVPPVRQGRARGCRVRQGARGDHRFGHHADRPGRGRLADR